MKFVGISSVKQRGGGNIVLDADASGIMGVTSYLHSMK